MAAQGARIWEVLRGIILTLGLRDIAGFSASHKSGAPLSSTYTVRFNNAERKKGKQRLSYVLLIDSADTVVLIRSACKHLC